jgi:hypothetical protein
MFMFLILIVLFIFPLIAYSFEQYLNKDLSFKICQPVLRTCHSQDLSFESFNDSITTDNLTNRTVKLITAKSSVESIQVWLPKGISSSSKIDIFEDEEKQDNTVNKMNLMNLRLFKFSDGIYTDLLNQPISISHFTTGKKVLEFKTQLNEECTLKKDDVLILQREYIQSGKQLPNLIKVCMK